MSEQACGCCTGVEAAVPASEVNPSGQSALHYRVGTYATFLETMLARLTGLTIEVPSASGVGTDKLTPLAGLTTRDPSGPSIALLDAFATVADVLTFYQERIANEGYLPTAIERRSILELARLIGYRLRPGVAASVKLAFTVANGFSGTLPVGTRAQSIPAAGQNPQFFETSADLDTRDAWNTLAPRLTRPQVITTAALDKMWIPLVTGANVIDTVYLAGTSTNISPGDALFFIFGPTAVPGTNPPQQYLRLAAAIDAQADQKRTEVTLNPPLLSGNVLIIDWLLLQLYVNKGKDLFAGSDLAQGVIDILQPLIANIIAIIKTSRQSGTNPAALLPGAISRIALLRGIAVERGFTRTAAWLAMLLKVMQWMSLRQPVYVPGDSDLKLERLPGAALPSPLANLGGIVDKLATPPSLQPANALRLTRSIAASFTPQSDIAPRLIAALRPAAAPALYQAWSAFATPAPRVEVHAARIKAGLFAASWAGPATVQERAAPTFTYPSIVNAWGNAFNNIGSDPPNELPLDATYDKIRPGSWVAIERPALGEKDPALVTFHIVTGVRTASMSAGTAPAATGSGAAAPAVTPTGTGFAAKVTLLKLDPGWLSDLPKDDSAGSIKYGDAVKLPLLLRESIVHAQSEPLDLAEEPLDTDVEGAVVDLANVYDGLEPGRWIIVSGTRTDIPGVSGVTASELAMIAGVAQGTQQPLCRASQPHQPFAQILYTTDANANGDRLVVGELSQSFALDKLQEPEFLNQQYCEQIELAPGVYANTYVPTAEEKQGSFPTFAGQLVNPNNVPFPNGKISDSALKSGLFAWRISTATLHTILTLASQLAYKYDRATITIYGNVVDATHGQSTGEILGNGNAAQAFASFTLGQSPLTYVSAPTPAGAASTMTVRVNELEWHEIDDLAGATPTQRCYVAREDNAHKTSVTFGNGVRGARLPTGTANVKATYRYGIGAAGNVAAGQISQLATHPAGAQGVINPLPATGGADADRIDQARANAPLTVTALDRLVSVRDYADFAHTYAGIGKAVAVRLSDGRRQLVHVTIAGSDDIPIDVNSDLFANLMLSLQTYGDPHLPVELAVRRVRLIVVAASVGLLPDYAWEDVAPDVRAAILARFAFNARALGQTAFLSEAIAAAQQVAGVNYVNLTTFDGVPQSITAGQLAALGSSLCRHQYVVAELARVDFHAEPGSPGRILPAELVFMTPDIPDTLILTQAV